MRGQKLLLTCYLASAIEHNKVVQDKQIENWKDIVKKEIDNPSVGVYDPVDRERQKTGQSCDVANQYIKNLKRAGSWENFDKVMDAIWWGDIKPGTDKLSIMQAVRNDFRMNGNTIDDLNHFADYQAVIRSDFIFACIEKDVKTVGTIKEIHTAYLLDIPVVLILPDQPPTEANSTLLSMVRDSMKLVLPEGSRVFGNAKDAVNWVKSYYKV
jgi:hypothetical protein